jgi:hypothetical protein
LRIRAPVPYLPGMADEIDLVAEYQEYLARFEASFGDVDFNVFVKHKSRLIKRLPYDEFETIYREYFAMAKAYFEAQDRGDTINDIVVKVLREHAGQLVLTSPV